MARKDTMQEAVNVGGIIGDGVTEDTSFLVMSMQGYLKFTDGKDSNKTKKVKMLIAIGKSLQIIDEDDFLRLLQV